MKAVMAALAAALLAAPAVPAARDWTRTVRPAPGGAFVIGNPAAKVRLVEYLSMTCNHCAAFTRESKPALAGPIRAGRLSVEVRHAVRDPADLAATLLARCAGPARFPALNEALFAAQPGWMARAGTFLSAGGGGGTDAGERLVALARGAGLTEIAAANGLPVARAEACLRDPAERERLAAMAAEAWQQRRIAGTPTFLINGQPATGANWQALEPQVVAALR